ncbi:hypothetical protein Q7C36_004225 [Tachysurus vachellii]|uniref:Uncharacterized protein n=1 Tax=Tachysurus vachellii TaxID=175792 RepID=A0AA88TAL7_TACVA|nr:hypothetical protein Q7C36_004225 [Tachysurus vachellii]
MAKFTPPGQLDFSKPKHGRTGNREKQKTNQTSEQNQSRAGVEDSQSGNTPLQADEAAAESNEATYVQVMKKKKAKRNNDLDGELSGSDVTYAQLEVKPKKSSMRKKEQFEK